jgi:Domain of unknown function (DUF4781)
VARADIHFKNTRNKDFEMAELRTGAGSYGYEAPQLNLQKPFDPLGDLTRVNGELKRIADTTEAERTRARILDHYLPALVGGGLLPNDKQLGVAINHTRKLLKQGSFYPSDRNKLEVSVNQLESLRDAMKAYMKGNASYADVGAAVYQVQKALRAAGLLPKASRNPFNQEAAKVPAQYVNREFLLQPTWSAPIWVLQSNARRDISMVNALDAAANTYRQNPTPENWKAFEQSRNHLNKYFNDSRFVSTPRAGQEPRESHGKIIQARLIWANQQIGLHHLQGDKEKLDRLAQAYFGKPSAVNEALLRKQMARVSDLAIKAAQDPQGYIGNVRILLDSNKAVESNVADPRSKKKRGEATYAGAAYPDTAGHYGLIQQTRIVEIKKGVGQAATTTYVAKGLYLTDAQGVQRGTPQATWIHPLTGAKTVAQAIAKAQANFKSGTFRFPPEAVTSGSVAPVTPTPTPSRERVAPHDANQPLFSTGKVAIYAQPTTFLDGDRNGKIRAALDDKIAPSAARFTLQSGQPVQLGQGDALLNNIGLAMNVPATRVPTVGNPLQYSGEALESVRRVYDKVVEVGGQQARLNILPVYMEQANGQIIMAPLFKVQRADGKGVEYLDTGLRRYASLDAFKNENRLPCKRMYVPTHGQLVARGSDGQAKRLQFDVVDNERFIDKALTITRGVVGGGSTVLAIGSAVTGGGLLVPPLLVGAGAVIAATAVADQWDRFTHGEDLSLSNEISRNNYFDIISSALGIGSLAAAGRLGRALAVADTVVGMAQQVDGVQQLVRNKDNMSPLAFYSQAATLAFFATLTTGSVVKNFSAPEVHAKLTELAQGKKIKTGQSRTPKRTPTSVNEQGPAPSKPLFPEETNRLRKRGLSTEGLSKARALTPEQIGRIATAVKASGSYEKALVLLSDIATVTGIPINKLAGTQAVGYALAAYKNKPSKVSDQDKPNITSQANPPRVVAMAGEGQPGVDPYAARVAQIVQKMQQQVTGISPLEMQRVLRSNRPLLSDSEYAQVVLKLVQFGSVPSMRNLAVGLKDKFTSASLMVDPGIPSLSRAMLYAQRRQMLPPDTLWPLAPGGQAYRRPVVVLDKPLLQRLEQDVELRQQFRELNPLWVYPRGSDRGASPVFQPSPGELRQIAQGVANEIEMLMRKEQLSFPSAMERVLDGQVLQRLRRLGLSVEPNDFYAVDNPKAVKADAANLSRLTTSQTVPVAAVQKTLQYSPDEWKEAYLFIFEHGLTVPSRADMQERMQQSYLEVLDDLKVANKKESDLYLLSGRVDSPKSDSVIAAQFAQVNKIPASKFIAFEQLKKLPKNAVVLIADDVAGTGTQMALFARDVLEQRPDITLRSTTLLTTSAAFDTLNNNFASSMPNGRYKHIVPEGGWLKKIDETELFSKLSVDVRSTVLRILAGGFGYDSSTGQINTGFGIFMPFTGAPDNNARFLRNKEFVDPLSNGNVK